MKSYREIDRCRICGNTKLIPILDLGRQALTGIFPRTKAQRVTAGPLELVKCAESRRGDSCGLVQLRQSYDKREMYGMSYGYRSGLNRSMVDHLHALVRKIQRIVPLKRGDMVLDIGSNDGTLLRGYPERGLLLVGMDPTGVKFRKYYPRRARLIPDFFSARRLAERFHGKKAKVVTSISMFYDLDAPLEFMAEVRSVMADDGIWMLEQSYLPLMLSGTAYDTVCHEHLEYYGLRQIAWMALRVGLKIVDVETNAINGGSFCVVLAKAESPCRVKTTRIRRLLRRERALGGLKVYRDFRRKVFRHRKDLLSFLRKAKKAGKVVIGYGASTKGNVILQFCGLTKKDIPMIGEVNPDKFGCLTPGTRIPIVSEKYAKSLRPDYLLALPWHFKDFILEKERPYLKSGGKIFFPLPRLEVIASGPATI